MSPSTRSPSSLGHSFFLLSGIYLHQEQHVRVATSCALMPRRYQNLSTTIMVFVCLYGFHKCISCLVCYWQYRSALRSAIACVYFESPRAGVARAIALYRDSWVAASVGQFNCYYCEHALSKLGCLHCLPPRLPPARPNWKTVPRLRWPWRLTISSRVAWQL